MNQRTSFENTACSIARTLNIIGEWWTILILRDIFYKITRFSALREHLGISRKILTIRLNSLIENNILKRKRYQSNPSRFEYILTEAGKELFPVIIALKEWGDKWIYEGKEIPIILYSDKSSKSIKPLLIDENTGKPIVYGSVRADKGSESFQNEWDSLVKAVEKRRLNS